MSGWKGADGVDEQHLRRERERARKLRRTQYWRRLLEKGVCHYCGRRFPPSELTMDHVVPLSRGGRSVKGNVVVCCKACNSRKQILTPVEMILEELQNGRERE